MGKSCVMHFFVRLNCHGSLAALAESIFISFKFVKFLLRKLLNVGKCEIIVKKKQTKNKQTKNTLTNKLLCVINMSD